MELTQSEQGIIITLTGFLQRKFCGAQRPLTKDRIKYSLDLLAKVRERCDRERKSATMMPQIDYRPIKFIVIPQSYGGINTGVYNAKWRAQGVPEGLIERIQRDAPLQFAQLEQQFEDYCESPYFHLEENETLEQLRAATVPAFLPATYIPVSAVPKRVEFPLDDRGTRFYALAAQMPTPQDAPHEMQLHNYLEECMNVLTDAIPVDSNATLYYNYQIVSRELGCAITPKIVLYVAVVNAREGDDAQALQ